MTIANGLSIVVKTDPKHLQCDFASNNSFSFLPPVSGLRSLLNWQFGISQ